MKHFGIQCNGKNRISRCFLKCLALWREKKGEMHFFVLVKHYFMEGKHWVKLASFNSYRFHDQT